MQLLARAKPWRARVRSMREFKDDVIPRPAVMNISICIRVLKWPDCTETYIHACMRACIRARVDGQVIESVHVTLWYQINVTRRSDIT